MSPSHGGVSFSAKIVLAGDSSFRLAVAPALQWCRKIWFATTQPGGALVSRAELLRLWKSARPLERGPWSSSRSPLSRAVLVLSRAGWEAVGPLEWKDHSGISIQIDETTPALPAD
eukprot:3987038-Pyramimonas_sp.AAC.1